MRAVVSFFSFLFFYIGIAQQTITPADSIQSALQQKQVLQQQSIVKNIAFKNIGPTIMSGRVTAIAVNPDNPIEFYVGYASGGLWHTINNGTTFTPIMDNTPTQNIGAIAVHWASRTIWVGTGENNSSRSSYAGIGILKTTDNGKTWENMGLHDSHHIGRILVNPNNKEEVVIGVTGHLYSPNKERGIYKTTDGGKTWQQTLFIDAATGIIDVQHAPHNFATLFASSWSRDRKAWHFEGSGSGSAIYKSTDAGTTWEKITTAASGFPTGKGVGRIGLAVYDDNTIYAIHDNQARRVEKDSTNEHLVKEDFKTMSIADFLALDNKKLNNFLKQNGFQEKYRAENVKQMVKSGEVQPIDVVHYLEDANALLFDTPVVGAEVYKSTDGGKTWQKTHADFLDDVYYSYGYYFGEIRVSALDKAHIYIMGVPILKSKDGGKTFTSISKENVHSDHQALWVNPKVEGHLINGNDGGINITYDDGTSWEKLNVPSVGQFYAINVDNETPYNVYGGLQDNGSWVGPHNAKQDKAWHESGSYPWKMINWGDGMRVEIDHRDSNIVYSGFQFGNYHRSNRKTNKKTYIQPKHELGDVPYRFNWQTPILLSKHNQDILYIGANKVLRSMNRGDDWEVISNDLTQGGKKGNVAYGTLTDISESPFQFGLLYVGSDDGYVHVSKNGGVDWKRISNSFPKDLWVSRVVASQHKKERVYVTLNGYRWDDFNTYVYKSDDYGQTWNTISSNIPMSPVNVIREDTDNENILYLGTDNGAYVSFNQGKSWEAFSKGLPSVAVHDMVVHPKAKHLLLATHGRGAYKADIANLQQFNSELNTRAITVFKPKTVIHSSNWGNSWSKWGKANIPELLFSFYTTKSGDKTVAIISENNKELYRFTVSTEKGFNTAVYSLEITEKGRKALLKKNKELTIPQAKNGKYYLPKGNYQFVIDGVRSEFVVE